MQTRTATEELKKQRRKTEKAQEATQLTRKNQWKKPYGNNRKRNLSESKQQKNVKQTNRREGKIKIKKGRNKRKKK
jgi:hypothetical protein